MDNEPLGPLRITTRPEVPSASAAYFVDAVSSALRRMRALGIRDEAIAGPVIFALPDEDSAGWYESTSDRLVIHARVSDETRGGKEPGWYYGADPATGFIVWALCHELAHRVWYRALTVSGRALWARFAEMQRKPLTKADALGVAWRAAVACYGVPGWEALAQDVPDIFDETASSAVTAGRDLAKTTQTIGAAMWAGWLKTRGYGSEPNANAARGFAAWVRDEGYRDALPTNYAEEHHKEAWSETIAAMAGSRDESNGLLGAIVQAVLGAPGERDVVAARVSLPWAVADAMRRDRVREGIWA